ncbi:MAG: sterile alpha motif-like domain-containing protein [Acidobacteriia bacterium]|nr:sterile alpha motif-like domain-containing protein [Terriglobia bacterium]
MSFSVWRGTDATRSLYTSGMVAVRASERRSSLTKTSFRTWLSAQVGRADTAGDFARDVAADVDAPAGGYEAWLRYLRGQSAPDPAIDAFNTAWLEWVGSIEKEEAANDLSA